MLRITWISHIPQTLMYYFQKLEEMQRSTVRQKDASETEGESIQNSDQASNAIRGRNVGYNEETGKTD